MKVGVNRRLRVVDFCVKLVTSRVPFAVGYAFPQMVLLAALNVLE